MAAVTTTTCMDITGLGSRMKVDVRQEKGREGDECKIYVYRWNCPVEHNIHYLKCSLRERSRVYLGMT